MAEQLSKIVEQLQLVTEMVERNTMQKYGSKASVGEFNSFFYFTNFPAQAWLATTPNSAFRSSARDLIDAHQSAMKIKRDAGQVKEVEHVQGDSKELLRQLMALYFPNQRVEVISERPYSCRVTNRNLESIRYIGKTDAVIKSTDYNIAVLCWEIKNLLVDLEGKGEIAQLAAEVSGELEVMLNLFDFKPLRYTAVLTNGLGFLFIMATIVNGVFVWRHSPLVTHAADAAKMIEGCFAVAAEILRSCSESLNMSMERLHIHDNDGDDSGKHNETRGDDDDDTKSNSQDASSDRTCQVLKGVTGNAVGNNKIGGAKTTENGTETLKSDNSQDYRYAPLTISNVDLFNRMRGGIFSF